MYRLLHIFFVLLISGNSRAQSVSPLLDKAVKAMYSEYKVFFDSSLLDDYIKLDTERTYYLLSTEQKIRSVKRELDGFVYDGFNLSFVMVYEGDTLTRMNALIDTSMNIIPLGTPGNPRRHGDVLPPYLELVKGNIGFNYKKLKGKMATMKITIASTELHAWPNKNGKPGFAWKVISACPQLDCRRIEVSAKNGKILADTDVKE